jgi:hypothetical protein
MEHILASHTVQPWITLALRRQLLCSCLSLTVTALHSMVCVCVLAAAQAPACCILCCMQKYVAGPAILLLCCCCSLRKRLNYCVPPLLPLPALLLNLQWSHSPAVEEHNSYRCGHAAASLP